VLCRKRGWEIAKTRIDKSIARQINGINGAMMRVYIPFDAASDVALKAMQEMTQENG
jgi:hypothetical protein